MYSNNNNSSSSTTTTPQDDVLDALRCTCSSWSWACLSVGCYSEACRVSERDGDVVAWAAALALSGNTRRALTVLEAYVVATSSVLYDVLHSSASTSITTPPRATTAATAAGMTAAAVLRRRNTEVALWFRYRLMTQRQQEQQQQQQQQQQQRGNDRLTRASSTAVVTSSSRDEEDEGGGGSSGEDDNHVRNMYMDEMSIALVEHFDVRDMSAAVQYRVQQHLARLLDVQAVRRWYVIALYLHNEDDDGRYELPTSLWFSSFVHGHCYQQQQSSSSSSRMRKDKSMAQMLQRLSLTSLHAPQQCFRPDGSSNDLVNTAAVLLSQCTRREVEFVSAVVAHKLSRYRSCMAAATAALEKGDGGSDGEHAATARHQSSPLRHSPRRGSLTAARQTSDTLSRSELHFVRFVRCMSAIELCARAHAAEDLVALMATPQCDNNNNNNDGGDGESSSGAHLVVMVACSLAVYGLGVAGAEDVLVSAATPPATTTTAAPLPSSSSPSSSSTAAAQPQQTTPHACQPRQQGRRQRRHRCRLSSTLRRYAYALCEYVHALTLLQLGDVRSAVTVARAALHATTMTATTTKATAEDDDDDEAVASAAAAAAAGDGGSAAAATLPGNDVDDWLRDLIVCGSTALEDSTTILNTALSPQRLLYLAMCPGFFGGLTRRRVRLREGTSAHSLLYPRDVPAYMSARQALPYHAQRAYALYHRSSNNNDNSSATIAAAWRHVCCAVAAADELAGSVAYAFSDCFPLHIYALGCEVGARYVDVLLAEEVAAARVCLAQATRDTTSAAVAYKDAVFVANDRRVAAVLRSCRRWARRLRRCYPHATATADVVDALVSTTSQRSTQLERALTVSRRYPRSIDAQNTLVRALYYGLRIPDAVYALQKNTQDFPHADDVVAMARRVLAVVGGDDEDDEDDDEDEDKRQKQKQQRSGDSDTAVTSRRHHGDSTTMTILSTPTDNMAAEEEAPLPRSSSSPPLLLPSLSSSSSSASSSAASSSPTAATMLARVDTRALTTVVDDCDDYDDHEHYHRSYNNNSSSNNDSSNNATRMSTATRKAKGSGVRHTDSSKAKHGVAYTRAQHDYTQYTYDYRTLVPLHYRAGQRPRVFTMRVLVMLLLLLLHGAVLLLTLLVNMPEQVRMPEVLRPLAVRLQLPSMLPMLFALLCVVHALVAAVAPPPNLVRTMLQDVFFCNTCVNRLLFCLRSVVLTNVFNAMQITLAGNNFLLDHAAQTAVLYVVLLLLLVPFTSRMWFLTSLDEPHIGFMSSLLLLGVECVTAVVVLLPHLVLAALEPVLSIVFWAYLPAPRPDRTHASSSVRRRLLYHERYRDAMPARFSVGSGTRFVHVRLMALLFYHTHSLMESKHLAESQREEELYRVFPLLDAAVLGVTSSNNNNNNDGGSGTVVRTQPTYTPEVLREIFASDGDDSDDEDSDGEGAVRVVPHNNIAVVAGAGGTTQQPQQQPQQQSNSSSDEPAVAALAATLTCDDVTHNAANAAPAAQQQQQQQHHPTFVLDDAEDVNSDDDDDDKGNTGPTLPLLFVSSRQRNSIVVAMKRELAMHDASSRTVRRAASFVRRPTLDASSTSLAATATTTAAAAAAVAAATTARARSVSSSSHSSKSSSNSNSSSKNSTPLRSSATDNNNNNSSTSRRRRDSATAAAAAAVAGSTEVLQRGGRRVLRHVIRRVSRSARNSLPQALAPTTQQPQQQQQTLRKDSDASEATAAAAHSVTILRRNKTTRARQQRPPRQRQREDAYTLRGASTATSDVCSTATTTTTSTAVYHSAHTPAREATLNDSIDALSICTVSSTVSNSHATTNRLTASPPHSNTAAATALATDDKDKSMTAVPVRQHDNNNDNNNEDDKDDNRRSGNLLPCAAISSNDSDGVVQLLGTHNAANECTRNTANNNSNNDHAAASAAAAVVPPSSSAASTPWQGTISASATHRFHASRALSLSSSTSEGDDHIEF